MRQLRRQWGWVAACMLATACSADDLAGDRASEPGAFRDTPQTTGNTGSGAAPGALGPTSAMGGGTNAEPPVETLPPEVEMTVDLQLPQASEQYVYAVSPEAGTVAVINATTQAIHSVKTGIRPTYLRTLHGTDNAIVLNIGSNKASVLRTKGNASTKTDLSVGAGANAIAVAPDGKHAVVYFNSSYASAGNSSGSYQDISVLKITADGSGDEAISMTIGFRPRDVFFSDDGARAFVVTEDGVSILDFAQIEKDKSGIAKLVAIGDNIDQKSLDVAITPNGRFALARSEGNSQLHMVELATGMRKSIDLAQLYVPPPATDEDPAADDAGVPPAPLPVVVTDLDLMPDGKGAIAVLRNQHAVLKLTLPDNFSDMPEIETIHVGGEVIGSVTVAPDGKSALAYTTAANVERLTVLDLTDVSKQPRTLALRKAILAVAFTPDSKTALITHTKLDGPTTQNGLSPDDVIDRSFGYSLVRVASGDVKLQVTQTALGPIAMVPDGSYVFIVFRNDNLGIREVQRVDLTSFLVDPVIPLENPPISIGTVATGTVFVNLQHPDGRMTFIDWREPLAKLKTVTGFELNSQIRD